MFCVFFCPLTNEEEKNVTVKGALPQNIFIIKSGHIGRINSQDIGEF